MLKRLEVKRRKKKRGKPHLMSGGEVKSRQDKARRGARRAVGGSSMIPQFGGGFGTGIMPYGGGDSYVPGMGITRQYPEDLKQLGAQTESASNSALAPAKELFMKQVEQSQSPQQTMQGAEGPATNWKKWFGNNNNGYPTSGNAGADTGDITGSLGNASDNYAALASLESRGGKVRRRGKRS